MAALWFFDNKSDFPKVSDRIIIEALRQSEEDNLISREVFKEMLERVEYAFILIGKSELLVLDVMKNQLPLNIQ